MNNRSHSLINRSYNVSHQFKKHVKRIKRGGRYNLNDLWHVLSLLAHKSLNSNGNITLPFSYHDHLLINYHGYSNLRELHIKPDWLLVYRVNNKFVYLYDTGSHNNIFR